MGSFGGALVEEFITGREFTVLVVEEPVGPGRLEGAKGGSCGRTWRDQAN